MLNRTPITDIIITAFFRFVNSLSDFFQVKFDPNKFHAAAEANFINNKGDIKKMAEQVNYESFGNILQDENTVLADFYSDSCGPCRRMIPVFSEIEQENRHIRTVKINVTADGELAREYEVRAVPTFILFKNGREASRIIGAVPKARLEDMINNA